MQTFLPYTDFIKGAKCLDYKRLGKQRIEAKTIYDILTGNAKSNAWKNHPATKMWEDYENSTELATGKIKKHLRNNSIWLLVMKCIKEGIKNYANKN